MRKNLKVQVTDYTLAEDEDFFDICYSIVGFILFGAECKKCISNTLTKLLFLLKLPNNNGKWYWSL